MEDTPSASVGLTRTQRALEEMMEARRSFSIDREGRGMPEKLKKPSNFVKSRSPQNGIFP
jgi:hypothetical protein